MRLSLPIFFITSILANFLLVIGGAAGSWSTFIIGRVLFMICTELLLISVVIIVINMFFNKGINFPLGIATIIPFCGIIMSEEINPRLRFTEKD